MKREQFNLDREFIKWFYEEAYPEQGSNRAQAQSMGMPIANIDVRDYWMRQAYKAGAESMWREVNETLLAYACAVEGLDPEMVTPAEVFDRARENLHLYVHEQLELFPV
jgi:hypothetical protein